MEKKMPKRLIIVAGFLILSDVIGIAAIVLGGGSGSDSFELPAYMSWYTPAFQNIFGLASSFTSLGLCIMLFMQRNVRFAFNIYYAITTVFGVIVSFAATYKAPAEAPEVQEFMNIMNTLPVKGMIICLTLIFVSVILWAVNSEKTRVFLGENAGPASEFTPSDEEIKKAEADRAADRDSIDLEELDLD